jgi:HEAT repeat protein
MLCGGSHSPVTLRRVALNLKAASPEEFRETAAQVCRTMFEQDRALELLKKLISAGLLELIIADAAIVSVEEALWLAREAVPLDSSIPLRIGRYILEPETVLSLPAKFRLLEILAELLDGSQSTPLISMLMSRADPRVRSRAAIVLRKHVVHPSCIREQVQSEDGRVRANAIESLWENLTPEHQPVLRKVAVDSNNRARGNALFGLYKLGVEGAKDLILEMAAHPDPAFRNTAAWVMGETKDDSFLGALEKMARTDSGAARMGALRALARIRKTIQV